MTDQKFNMWFWAIGLFEGEGCIGYTITNRPRLQVASTDLDTLERFRDVVGFGNISGPRRKEKPHHKDCWRWASAQQGECLKFLIAALPLLSQRRQQRAIEVIDHFDSRLLDGYPVHLSAISIMT